MCLTLCVTTFADSNAYWEDGPYDVIWNEKENAMWWKKYSFLLMYPMAVFGVVGSSYYASGQLNTFDKWYLIVLSPWACGSGSRPLCAGGGREGRLQRAA